jgi:hypothetical protein
MVGILFTAAVLILLYSSLQNYPNIRHMTLLSIEVRPTEVSQTDFRPTDLERPKEVICCRSLKLKVFVRLNLQALDVEINILILTYKLVINFNRLF